MMLENLRNKDWTVIAAHYVIYTSNSDSVRELLEKPVKLYLLFVFGGKHALGEMGLEVSVYVLGTVGVLTLPFYLAWQYVLGRHKKVLKFKNRMEQLTRKRNDVQRDKVYSKILGDDLKEAQK